MVPPPRDLVPLLQRIDIEYKSGDLIRWSLLQNLALQIERKEARYPSVFIPRYSWKYCCSWKKLCECSNPTTLIMTGCFCMLVCTCATNLKLMCARFLHLSFSCVNDCNQKRAINCFYFPSCRLYKRSWNLFLHARPSIVRPNNNSPNSWKALQRSPTRRTHPEDDCPELEPQVNHPWCHLFFKLHYHWQVKGWVAFVWWQIWNVNLEYFMW